MATQSETQILQKREESGRLATGQQRKAADPAVSVWVEASAGTGKTKVLSDRVLRLLLNKVNPLRILCLTYTKAAAVEMNTRISERLAAWAVESDEKLQKDLRKLLNTAADGELAEYQKLARTLFAVLLDTPGGLKIQTIHSFCQEVLKRFPLEAGVVPYFEVLDDTQAAEILAQIKSDLLQYAEQQPESAVSRSLQYLTSHLSEHGFSQIMQNITDNRGKIDELLAPYANFADFATALATKLAVDPQSSVEKLQADFMAHIDSHKARANVAAWSKGGVKDKTKAENLAGIIARGLVTADYDAYCALFISNGAIVKQPACKAAVAADSELLSRLQAEAERALACERQICRLNLYHATFHTLQIAHELHNRYADYKQQNAVLDYADLIWQTRRLLADPAVADWVLYKLDGGIDHILLDEAQDTSPEQWDIIKSLSTEFFAGKGGKQRQATVFAVGDRKQSIYSFQGADPDKFDVMSHYFAQKAGQDFQKINLAVSFRSTAAILDAVNAIFAHEEIARGVAAADEKVHHIPFREGEYGRVEIWPLLVAPEKDKDKNPDYWQPPVERKQEVSVKSQMARQIAREILRLRSESQTTARPLHFRDFMVLVQRRSSFVNEFIRACKEMDVAICGADKLRLTDQIAVQDLISLGKFLLLPNDDLSLAEVLKSPLFGLDDDDLMKLCYHRGAAPLWSRLGDMAAYAAVYAELQNLLNMVDYVRPYELYNYVLTKQKGRYKFIERIGIEVEDALDEFINLTLDYERRNIPSLQGFIAWISSSSIDIKRETEQKDNDAVRLMTVHGSKGLQAPVVFLPDTVRVKASKREQMFLWNGDMAYYPLSADYYDANCEQIKEQNQRKAMEEYRRLLYVALTRAEDRLYICGFSNSEKIAVDSWYNICRQYLVPTDYPTAEKWAAEVPALLSPPEAENKVISRSPQALPTWLYENATPESPLAKPYTPSKPLAEDDELDSSSPLQDNGRFYRRGTLIHKLLQFLPANTGDKRAVMREFLHSTAAELSAKQQNQIIEEVATLLENPQYAEIFGPASRAEVPIMGEVGGKIISAQLDRLIVLPDKVIVVDFKTNRPAAQTLKETPPAYVAQLGVYADLLRRIYPQKTVEAYILWTNLPHLMRVI